MNAPVHRGIAIGLNPEDHAIVHDPRRPAGERAAHLLDAVTREGHEPLGQHWTTDRDWADHFAQQYGGYQDGQTHVVFHATHPDHDEIEHDPAWRQEHEVNDSEDEVPIRRGVGVEVTGVSWREHTKPGAGPAKSWTHHQLDEEQWHTAVLRRVATIVLRRTAAADWEFSHHHVEGPHWRSFGGPAGDRSKSVMAEYKLRDGGVQFDTGTMHEHQVRKHGPEAVERLHDAVRQHHGVGDAPPEAPPPPVRPKPRVYFHGTTAEDVTHVLPANRHRGGVMFPSDTDHDYAYASLDKDAAWSYAEKAHYVTGGKPRVYQVRPLHGDHSHVEDDPTWDDARNMGRGNYEGDRRSKVGFEVVRELKTPRHIHENYDWHEKEDEDR